MTNITLENTVIYFLKGLVDIIGDDYTVMDVNGVGYHAFTSSKTLSSLEKGTATTLYIYTHVREQELSLFGFSSEEERSWFMLLTSVSGVGPKVGLALLSALNTDEIVDAISRKDGKMLARANGVGPKLGERIALELKDKVGALPTSIHTNSTSSTSGIPDVGAEVLSALSNLGYKGPIAQKAVISALEKSGGEAQFDILFKTSLQELR